MYRFIVVIVSLALLFLSANSLLPQIARAGTAGSKRAMSAAARQFYDQGNALFKAKKYREAEQAFARACQISGRNNNAQFYLGTAALYAGNRALYIDSMTNIVAMNKLTHSVITKTALVNLLKYSRLHPYSALNSQGQLCRWDKTKHPVIYICVTQGLALPPEYQGKSMSITDIRNFQKLFRSGQFARSLVREPGFQTHMAQQAISGLRQWDWAVREGLFKYAFTNDVNKANIVVLWCKGFAQSKNMRGLTSNFASSRPGSGKAIMQLPTSSISGGSDVTQAMIAHEFGHAFGLGSHSPNNEDIMTAKIYYTTNGSKYWTLG